MKLVLMRHGESEADILNVIEGRADFALTDKGTRQADAAGIWLSNNEEVDRIISSPLKRAKETAEIIGSKLEINVDYSDLLKEWDNGLLAGLTREEADRLYPLPQGGKKPHHAIANSESKINFRARAETFISQLREEDGDSNILIVSHGGMINMIYQSILGMPTVSDVHIKCEDTSLHKFRIVGTQVLIEYINKVDHIEVTGN